MSTSDKKPRTISLTVPEEINDIVKQYNKLVPGNPYSAQLYEYEYYPNGTKVVKYYGLIYEAKLEGDSDVVFRTDNRSQQKKAEANLKTELERRVVAAGNSDRQTRAQQKGGH